MSRRVLLAPLIAGALMCPIGCGGGDRQPLPASQVPGVEQTTPSPQRGVEPPAPTAAPKPVAAPIQQGPAAPVIVNGVLTNGDAAMLADYQQRLAQYVNLKKRIDKRTPDQKETHDPAEIQAKQKMLAGQIIQARTGARRGDIFTPQIQAKFRQLLLPEVKGTTGKETKQEITEDFAEGGEEAGNPKAALRVNVEYPDGTPLATTPPNVLQALPTLPDGLEYRFVGNYLLIRDVDADIVVDFMPAAIR